MKVTITPSQLGGTVRAIASKSCAHRLLICASLADRETVIRCSETNRDIDATVQCLCAMGADISREGEYFRVRPLRKVSFANPDCGESGSTLRFLLPVLCALGQNADVRMHGRLPERPMEPLWSELIAHGAILKKNVPEVISVSGKLTGTDYTLAADVSSQYISGLLFALPLLGGGTIRLTGKIESEGYITMTRNALAAFGVETTLNGDLLSVFGSYHSPGEAVVEGDWSNGAFWLAANAISSSRVLCTGLDENSAQGDRKIIDAIARIRRSGAVIDASQIPDLVPILSVVAALTPGRTEIVNAARLRLKESDRLETVTEMLTELGGEIHQTEDGLIISGKDCLRGGVTNSRNDHRIAMSAAIASIGCENPVIIEDAQAVQKSYPKFFEDFAALGGCVEMEA